FADPLVAPRPVVVLLVAARAVDGREFLGDLLAMRPQAAGHLVDGDVYAPLAAGALDPALGAAVAEGEPLGGHVIGVAHVHARILLGRGIGLVEDGVHGRARRGRPAAEQAGPLERVPGQGSEPDHVRSSSSSSASLMAFTVAIGHGGSPAVVTARVN